MARGDCQRDFATAALDEEVRLTRRTFPWLTRRGHLDLPDEAAEARVLLARIFLALGGSTNRLESAPSVPLQNDFYYAPRRALVEVDEHQHFTTARQRTLLMYPDDTVVGYDVEHYVRLCARTSERADKYFANKPGGAFGPGGRQQQRAYNDALRDLAAPAMGYVGVIRAPAIDRDGAGAWVRVRNRVVIAG